MSEAEVTMTKQNPTPVAVPLGTLIGRELRNESKVEKPTVKYGQATLAKKGEDYFLIKPDCQRISGSSTTSFSIFAIFDGHNGISAAIFAKENLLNNVLSAIPQGLGWEEWLQALPRALVAGFVKTDIEFQQKGETSGTTVTFVVIGEWTVTVASVGDSRCILDTQGGVVSLLTVDHRLEENEEERECVTASGGEVGRLNECSGGIRPWQGELKSYWATAMGGWKRGCGSEDFSTNSFSRRDGQVLENPEASLRCNYLQVFITSWLANSGFCVSYLHHDSVSVTSHYHGWSTVSISMMSESSPFIFLDDSVLVEMNMLHQQETLFVSLSKQLQAVSRPTNSNGRMFASFSFSNPCVPATVDVAGKIFEKFRRKLVANVNLPEHTDLSILHCSRRPMAASPHFSSRIC
nr:probable protein phosphatase 2C 5 [Ipomoea batatas]